MRSLAFPVEDSKSLQPPKIQVLVMIGLFVAMGIAIILITPYGKFADEVTHFNYANHIKTTGSLPRLSININETQIQEAHQPPLYYGCAAILLLVPLSFETSVYLLRFFSLILASLSIWLIYRTAILIFTNRYIALLSVAIAAFNPQYLYVNCGITNIPMMALTGSLTLYYAVRIASLPKLRFGAIFLGLSFGAALLTRPITICLLPICLFALFLQRQQNAVSGKNVYGQLLIFFAAAFAISGWWFIFNWLHYGDPLAWKVTSQTVGIEWAPAETVGPIYIIKSLAWLHAYFWIYFGNNEYHAGIFEYAVYLLIEVLGLLGIFEMLRTRSEQTFAYRRDGFLLLLWAAALALLEIVVLQFRISLPQGRYLYMVISAFSIVMAAGLVKILGPRRQRYGSTLITAFLGCFWIYILMRYWLPHFV